MKVLIFFSDGLIGNITINKVIPKIIAAGLKPILIKSRGPNSIRANIPELVETCFYEKDILANVVEPFFRTIPPASNWDDDDIHYTYENLIKKYNLEYHFIEDINDNKFIQKIIDDKDIIGGISIRFYPIFKKKIIQTLRLKGFLWNLHTGLLPKYKGVYIPYRAIANNDRFYGWSLHKVNEKIDTGDIIASAKLPLDPKKPVLNTYIEMSGYGASLIIGALSYYKKFGDFNATTQTKHKESYFTFPTSKEMQQWNRIGITFAGDIIKTYCDYYTPPNSLHRKELKKRLEKTLSIYNKKSSQSDYIIKLLGKINKKKPFLAGKTSRTAS